MDAEPYVYLEERLSFEGSSQLYDELVLLQGAGGLLI